MSTESEVKKGLGRVALIAVGAAALTAGLLLLVPFFGIRCLFNGHIPSSEYIVIKYSDCQKEGVAVLKCRICGETLDRLTLERTTDHNFVNGRCTVCGIEDSDYVSPEIIVPSDNITPIFKARSLVELHVRTGPGLSYLVIRNLPYYSTVDVYETVNADGYTWNRIGQGEWVANDGTYLERVY